MVVGLAATDGRLALAQELCLRQIQFEFRKWKNNMIGVNSRSFSDGSLAIVPSSGLLKEVREGLLALWDY
jgi:hypothetical protein